MVILQVFEKLVTHDERQNILLIVTVNLTR